MKDVMPDFSISLWSCDEHPEENVAILEGETEDWKFAASVFTLVDFFFGCMQGKKPEKRKMLVKDYVQYLKCLSFPTKKCI